MKTLLLLILAATLTSGCAHGPTAGGGSFWPTWISQTGNSCLPTGRDPGAEMLAAMGGYAK